MKKTLVALAAIGLAYLGGHFDLFGRGFPTAAIGIAAALTCWRMK